MVKMDLPLYPGDRVVLQYVDVCRAAEKVIERVDDGADRVWFTDGSSYQHTENASLTLRLLGEFRQPVMIP